MIILYFNGHDHDITENKKYFELTYGINDVDDSDKGEENN